MAATNLATRLTRLLSIVPYFVAHPGQSIREAAASLGMSVSDLQRDLNQLWLCGLPGYSPGDLIDISIAGESVEIGFSAGVDRPLRLSRVEATLLVVALRVLAELPSGVDPTAALSAISKIERATSVTSFEENDAPSNSVSVATDNPATPTENTEVMQVARAALIAGNALRIRYYSATSDAVTTRIIDPIRIVIQGRNSYIHAWCRDSHATRLFRVDRLDEAVELNEKSQPPHDSVVPEGFWGEDHNVPQAMVAVSPQATWLLEYHDMKVVEEVSSDHDVRVSPDWIVARLSYGSQDWLRRFVLGHGLEIQLLEPAELNEAVTQSAHAAVARYALLASSTPTGVDSQEQSL